jgi:molybdenum cofactor cytidylyltransferase
VIAAAILAAGEGARFGGPKALAEIGGRSLLEIVVETCARSLADEVVAVVGASHEAACARVEAARARLSGQALRCVVNDRWREGRTTSVQAAWASCPAGWSLLVVPVDHPAVRLVTLDALFGVFGYAAGEPDVTVPVVEVEGRRRRGHPILLSHRLRDEVLALGPNEPLHDVVHRHVVLEVPVDDPGILLDIDEPGDLERATELLGPS